MSRKRKLIVLPLDLILDGDISANAKIVYAVLSSFSKTGFQGASASTPATVSAAHREVVEKSNLSQHTVVKSLDRLEHTGWIARERRSGSANRYVFTTPAEK